MTKSVIVWIYVTYFCYLLQPVCTGTTYTSKACYGAGGLVCTRHDISCNSTQKIAIYDAYYTNNTECPQRGLSSCGNISADGVTEHGYHRFNNTELVPLYKNCSTKSQCVFQGPRRGTNRTFSVVKYQCIVGTLLNISGGDAKVFSQVSLIHRDEAFVKSNAYVCNFTSSVNVSNISVYALDSRLGRGTQGQCLSQLSVLRRNNITTNNCSTVFTPFERLNITWTAGHLQPIFFKDTPKLSSGLIWLLINATDPFNVTCETVERTTERTGTSKLTTVNLVASTNVSTPSGQTENDTGAIAGGVVATVLAVLVVTLVSVWIKRHRQAKSEVKENTSAMSMDAKPDMTYSLAINTPRNNYHEIQDLKTHNSDYDYATADGMVLPPTTNTYFAIEPAGKLTANGNSTARTAEGEYDHIGDKPPPQTSDYDTTASVAQPGNTGEDSYGYNHFQKKANSQTHQHDYDTSASATKAVAQLSTTERNTDEDDYDHFHRGTNASETVSSPYDTTSGVEDNPDYSVAGQMK